MPHPMRLAILADLRQQRHITLQEMAAACGLHGPSGRDSVSAWEQGRSIPHPRRRAGFLHYLAFPLGLAQDPARFQQIWAILADEWGWAPISPSEWQFISDRTIVWTDQSPASQQQPAALADPQALRSQTGIAAPLPPGSRMPLQRNPLFVGRQSDLQTLILAFLDQQNTSPLSIAVTGIAGIGKTQLAIELIYQIGAAFPGGVFWINCADAATVPAEIAACGGSDALALAPDYVELPLDLQVRMVLDTWKQTTPRLLIFDNCEDDSILWRWRPGQGGCQVLITSQKIGWDTRLAVRLWPLSPLKRSDSVELLQSYGLILPGDRPILAAIAAHAGDLPLALHLAGSFLARQGGHLSAEEYLAQIQQPGQTLNSILQHPSMQQKGQTLTGHSQHILRSFAVSYDQLRGRKKIERLARIILACAARFAPGEAIPQELLLAAVNAYPQSIGLVYSSREAAKQEKSQNDRAGALDSDLSKPLFSPTLRAQREAAKQEKSQNDRAGALDSDLSHPLFCPTLRAQREAAKQEKSQNDRAGVLDSDLSHPLFSPAMLAQREAAKQEKSQNDRAGVLDSDLSKPLFSSEVLAHKQLHSWPAEQRDLALKRALDSGLLEPVKLPDSSATQQSLRMHCLIAAFIQIVEPDPRFQHIVEQAVITEASQLSDERLPGLLLAFQGQLRAVSEAARPRRDLQSARLCGLLGWHLTLLSAYTEAEHYLQLAVELFRECAGPTHTETAGSLNMLGLLHQWSGKLVAAQPFLEQALQIWEQNPGTQVDYYASALNNLGLLLTERGDYKAAERHLRQALDICPLLGAEHPTTLRIRTNYGHLLTLTDHLAEAELELTQVLAIRTQLLPDNHPSLAQTMHNLGNLYQAKGLYQQARSQHQQALAIRKAVFGEQHGAVAESMAALAQSQSALGKTKEAQRLLEQALAINELVLGDQHIETAQIWDVLGQLYQTIGNHDKAKQAFGQAHSVYTQQLVAGHAAIERVKG